MIRVGRTRFTRLSEAESDVKFHPSVLTKNKLHLVHTSRGPYLWAQYKSCLVSYMEACDHALSVMLDWHTYLSR